MDKGKDDWKSTSGALKGFLEFRVIFMIIAAIVALYQGKYAILGVVAVYLLLFISVAAVGIKMKSKVLIFIHVILLSINVLVYAYLAVWNALEQARMQDAQWKISLGRIFTYFLIIILGFEIRCTISVFKHLCESSGAATEEVKAKDQATENQAEGQETLLV